MSLHRVLQRLAREATEHESGTADGHAPVAEAHRVLLSLIREDEASVRAVIDMAEEFDRLRAAGQQTWNASEALLRACLGGRPATPVASASPDLVSAAEWLERGGHVVRFVLHPPPSMALSRPAWPGEVEWSVLFYPGGPTGRAPSLHLAILAAATSLGWKGGV